MRSARHRATHSNKYSLGFLAFIVIAIDDGRYGAEEGGTHAYLIMICAPAARIDEFPRKMCANYFPLCTIFERFSRLDAIGNFQWSPNEVSAARAASPRRTTNGGRPERTSFRTFAFRGEIGQVRREIILLSRARV